MQRIGLISDTHGYLDPQVFSLFADCDQIWHAGDFGTLEVSRQLAAFKTLRGVYGNVDDEQLRRTFSLHDRFECEGVDVWMTHIGGYPGHYDRRVSKSIHENPPDLFICGHTHILRVMRDRKLNNMLYFNPGAAGRQGFHTIRTLLRFEIAGGTVGKLQAIELGLRAKGSCQEPQPNN